MQPPKTGVPQRDKMRDLLRDALALALDDVPDGKPGVHRNLDRSCAGSCSDPNALSYVLAGQEGWPILFIIVNMTLTSRELLHTAKVIDDLLHWRGLRVCRQYMSVRVLS
jgi:hypothetical protein